MNNIKIARQILETSINAANGSTQDFDFYELKEALAYIVDTLEQDLTDFYLEDFCGGEVRIIHKNDIDEIQQEELKSDMYVLGCFNADFVAKVTGLPQQMIEACQQAEAYEAIGEGILATDSLEKLQSEYASEDGYGHHFARYDGETHETENFYIFRSN